MGQYTQDNRLLKIRTPFDDNYLLMNSLKGDEGISRLFSFEVELLHEEKAGWAIPEVIDKKKILGQPVSIEINQIDGRGRMLNGIVSEFSQGSRGTEFTQYWVTIVPKVWILTQKVQSRIFQQKSVPSILKEVFEDFGNMIVWELEYEYKPRNYCVQYRESDFDFASRLMEEEGIYYFFEHKDDRHTMIVSDKPRFTRDCPGDSNITFSFEATEGEFRSQIHGWETDYTLQSGMISFRDHHIQQPGKKLAVTSATKFTIGENGDWEVYDYPGGYAHKFDGIGPGGAKTPADLNNIIPDGNRTAQTVMEALDARFMLGSGRSDVPSLTSGHKFKMADHPISDLNGEYVLTSVSHIAYQSPAYFNDSEVQQGYTNEFQALAHGRPGAVPFRPMRTVEKPIIYGAQTAVVVGPPDEEIYTDDYGRIKVQFHWDREGKTDGSDSCWVPVAQAWAGSGWGSMYIPRVGMEVIVHFFEGNPDDPIVSGCVYHPTNMPPYELPKEKTKSTIKTYSTKGGNGFNEFRFEDLKGKEQIFIHGERDLDIRIKNDRREWTGKDQHLIVKNDLYEMVEQDTHLTVKRDQIEHIKRDRHLKVGTSPSCKEAKEVTGDQSLKVGGNRDVSVTGNIAEEATGSVYLKGMNVVVEGMTQLSLKVGGNFVDINPAGVFIQGTMVMINSGGAAGSGSPASIVPPTAPVEPIKADDAKPGTKATIEKQSLERKKKKPKEDEEPSSFIDIALVDEEGNPVPGESYEVIEPDGTVRSGTLNRQGKAHVLLSKPGNCKVSFPNLDKGAWEDA